MFQHHPADYGQAFCTCFMVTFFQNHVRWLWLCFHWMRYEIYAPWTLAVFVFIGIAQAVIGWESGELAVKALPLDACTPNEKKRYVRLVRILASLLLPATAFIGVVNDRSQKDADDKAVVATRNATLTQDKLDQSEIRALHSDQAFQVFAKSLDPKKLSIAQFAKYTQAQKALSQTPLSPPMININEESVAAKSNQPSLFSGQTAELTPEDLRHTRVLQKIQDTQLRVNSIAGNTNEHIQFIFSSVRLLYIVGSHTEEERVAAFNATLPEVKVTLAWKDAEFQRLLPELESERKEALRLINYSPKDTANDALEYSKALTNSTRPILIPKSWAYAGDLYQSNYWTMNAYLSGLTKRVLETR